MNLHLYDTVCHDTTCHDIYGIGNDMLTSAII
jgi:hypothetical protein